jgi:hypothetical protein
VAFGTFCGFSSNAAAAAAADDDDDASVLAYEVT